MLMTKDSRLHMSILSLSGGEESEWKRCSSLLRVEKTLNVRVSPLSVEKTLNVWVWIQLQADYIELLTSKS